MENPFAPELLLEASGTGVVRVTLNRPEAFNSANERLHLALIAVWSYLEADPTVRAVVLTGAGSAFSAGGDFQHFRDCQEDTALRRREVDGAGRLVTAMVGCGLPIVAAVNGPAVGLGCNLAVLSDIVLIAEDTYLADPHVGVGLTAADGGAPTWPVLIGLLRAKEYLFTGDRIPAQQAVSIGLANRAVAGPELIAEAHRLAERLAAQPAHALRTTKKALNMHLTRAISGVLEYALAEEYVSFDTPEHKAVVDGFLTRRAAKTSS